MNLDNTKVLECRQIVSEWISANENEFVDIISSGGERPKFVTKRLVELVPKSLQVKEHKGYSLYYEIEVNKDTIKFRIATYIDGNTPDVIALTLKNIVLPKMNIKYNEGQKWHCILLNDTLKLISDLSKNELLSWLDLSLKNAKEFENKFQNIVDINLSNAIARQFGFDTYIKIMWYFKDANCDLSSNEEFQKIFNGYYRIRRNMEWREIYYQCFENIRTNKGVEFDDIIDYLYEKTGNVEASFSSKMLATINPELPILDSQVLANLGMEIKGSNDKKLENAKEVYQEICNRYNKYIGTLDCEKALKKFDEAFPMYKGFTSTKKIDFFLWSLTRVELENMGIFGGLINCDDN